MHESGDFDAFVDSIMNGVVPEIMIGPAGIKVATYLAGLLAGLLSLRREYCRYLECEKEKWH